MKKVKSKGSCTAEWLIRTFDEYLDAVYFSTNPFINSKNIPLAKNVGGGVKKRVKINLNWNPTEHFRKVIDVWEREWNQKQGTVLPSTLNKVVLNSNYRDNKKIIHYMQPHEPYLELKKNDPYSLSKNKVERVKPRKSFKQKLLNEMNPFVKPIISSLNKKNELKIRKFFGMKLSNLQKLFVNGNIKKIKSLYKKNLKVVLKNVSKLSENLSGKTIITADHGEAFGERGSLGHTYNSNNPVLRKVPWFEVGKK